MSQNDQNFKNLRVIADSIPALISRMDTDLRYTFVNSAYERWFNIKRTDILGKPVKEFVGDVVFGRALPHLLKALAGELVSFEQESPYPTGVKHIQVVYTPDVDEQTGQVTGIVALVNDVTDRKNLELKLERANRLRDLENRKLMILLEQAPMAMALLEGPQHNFVFANTKFKEFFASEKAYLHLPMREIFFRKVNEEMISLLDDVYQNGKSFKASEYRFQYFLRGQEEEIFANLLFEPIHDETGAVREILVAINDVSEQVEARKTIEASLSKLEEEQEIRERFVATLTHDLRTPLTAAKLGAQLLMRRSPEQEVVVSTCTKIIKNVDRTEAMVKDLLDANRINAGEGLPVSLQECDLSLVVKRTVEEMSAIHGRQILKELECAEVLGVWDPDALQRVLENLIGNAVKYGRPESSIRVSLKKNPTGALLEVHNEGSPISEEDQRQLFRSYRRTTSALSSGQKGWGIGLSLVKGLTEAHGGKVWVKSGIGLGTSFFVELPFGNLMRPELS